MRLVPSRRVARWMIGLGTFAAAVALLVAEEIGRAVDRAVSRIAR